MEKGGKRLNSNQQHLKDSFQRKVIEHRRQAAAEKIVAEVERELKATGEEFDAYELQHQNEATFKNQGTDVHGLH